jgi:hypothetical protein
VTSHTVDEVTPGLAWRQYESCRLSWLVAKIQIGTLGLGLLVMLELLIEMGTLDSAVG